MPERQDCTRTICSSFCRSVRVVKQKYSHGFVSWTSAIVRTSPKTASSTIGTHRNSSTQQLPSSKRSPSQLGQSCQATVAGERDPNKRHSYEWQCCQPLFAWGQGWPTADTLQRHRPNFWCLNWTWVRFSCDKRRSIDVTAGVLSRRNFNRQDYVARSWGNVCEEDGTGFKQEQQVVTLFTGRQM